MLIISIIIVNFILFYVVIIQNSPHNEVQESQLECTQLSSFGECLGFTMESQPLRHKQIALLEELSHAASELSKFLSFFTAH